MSEPRLAIFDDLLGRWGPLTRLRPIFDQRTAMRTFRQRIERTLGQAAEAVSVEEPLIPVQAARESDAAVNEPLPPGDWLIVAGRWDGLTDAETVRGLAMGQALLDAAGALVAARLDAEVADTVLRRGTTALPDGLDATASESTLPTRPWHLLNALPQTLTADLAEPGLSPADQTDMPGVTVLGQHPVYLGQGVAVRPGAVLNAEQGPIALDRGACVQPLALVEGPCFVGRNSEVAGHGYLRPSVAIGPGCKMGGELARAIVQSHSNKAHDGYLGDSLIGSWCNLGAGTTASNLKNTYGHMRVQLEPDASPEETGRRRQGAILGDLVRTAIGTRLLTGSVIGTGCMIATSGFAPRIAPPLGFYTDQGRAEHDPESLIALADWMKQKTHRALAAGEAAILRGLARRNRAEIV